MNFCQNCGKELKPGARFCGCCGANTVTENPPPMPPPVNTAFGESWNRNKYSQEPALTKNSQRRIVNLWLIFMAVFIFLIFLPSIIGLDGMEGGFALSFVAVFMVILSIIVILMYNSRAKQLDKIINGEGRIAIWRYSSDEWMKFISIDFKEEKKAKKFLFFLVSGICVVVGIILLLVVQDVLILLISLGIIPVVAIPAFLAPRMRYRKLQNSPAEAIIAENGLIVGKMFHLWVKMGATLDQVVLITDEQPLILEFHYSMPTRTGRQEEVARVPVPSGKLDEAEQIGNYFSNRM